MTRRPMPSEVRAKLSRAHMARFASPTERFARGWEPDLFGGCWLWTGHSTGIGYGSIQVAGRRMLAHRLSHELNIGPIPDGLFVLHRCDVPSCVNPAHLFLGTQGDNNRDKLSKGRGNTPHGSAHSSAKLSEEIVREIRQRHANGDTQVLLAAEYGVARASIGKLLQYRSWKHA